MTDPHIAMELLILQEPDCMSSQVGSQQSLPSQLGAHPVQEEKSGQFSFSKIGPWLTWQGLLAAGSTQEEERGEAIYLSQQFLLGELRADPTETEIPSTSSLGRCCCLSPTTQLLFLSEAGKYQHLHLLGG